MKYIIHGTNDFKKVDRNYHLRMGSWGTPEFGITEAIGDFFGVNRNQQGGSNLSGKSITSPLPANITPTSVYGSGGTAPAPVSPSYSGNTSVLGAQTTTSSGGGGTPSGNYNVGDIVDGYRWNGVGWDPSGNTGTNYEDQVRGDINSGYDSYFRQLDDILNTGLPQQRQAQEGIAQSQYNQGFNTLTSQRDVGLNDLGSTREKAKTQQSRTLNDLSDNIRNLFQTGNVYLGAKGAADSSASDQYAYALTKLGSKERGNVTGQYADIQNDINDREFKLKSVYDTETKNLQETLNQQINSISSWFAQQQNALKQAKAQGQLSKGQDLAALSKDLLNVALQQVQNIQNQAQAKRSALEEWAINNSTNINQLKSNLASVSSTNYNMPSASPVNGMPGFAGGAGNPSLYGFGNSETPKRDIFGNQIA